MGTMTDKIICPWCGAEMHHCGIKRTYEWEGHEMCGKCGATSPKRWAISQDAVRTQSEAAALSLFTPPIKPMTLEEVWKEEDPVWVEGKNGALYIGDFYASMSAKNGWDVQTLGSVKPRLMLEDYYGKTWRCWERKPTDDERSAAGWEK